MTYSYRKFTWLVMIMTCVLFGVYSYFVIFHKILFMNIRYPEWAHVIEYVNTSNDPKSNVIAIGDSRTKAGFIARQFDSENYKSINLAMSGASPIEGYFTVKKYIENNGAPEHLIIGYAPPLLTIPYSYLNTVKYGFLEAEEYEEVLETATRLNDLQIIGDIDYMDYRLYTGKYLTDLINGVLEQRWQINLFAEKMLVQEQGHRYMGRAKGSSQLSYESKQSEFVHSKVINEYFVRTLLLANENNVKVYWYTSPLNQGSVDAMAVGYADAYHEYMRNISDDYGLNILSEINVMPDEKFGDPDHIYLGAPEVTDYIKSRFLELNQDG